MALKSVRWLGHAGFLISSPQGKSVLVDPWIVGNPACPVKVEDFKQIDLILVSHDHFDHVGNTVDIARRTGAQVATAPETINRFRGEMGLPEAQVVYGFGMNIGGSATINGITITMTQAFHSSLTGTPAGWIITLEDGSTIYHAGDTGIFDSMKLLAELYPLDLALLPIGGCFTMDPVQAARSLTLLRPKKVIPMHFRTFPILEQDAQRFVNQAKKEAPGVQVVVLEPGQEHRW